MEEKNLLQILSHFDINGKVQSVKPLGNGLINDTYKVETEDKNTSDYIIKGVRSIKDFMFYNASTMLFLPMSNFCKITLNK